MVMQLFVLESMLVQVSEAVGSMFIWRCIDWDWAPPADLKGEHREVQFLAVV